jgi:hypothetical protein
MRRILGRIKKGRGKNVTLDLQSGRRGSRKKESTTRRQSDESQKMPLRNSNIPHANSTWVVVCDISPSLTQASCTFLHGKRSDCDPIRLSRVCVSKCVRGGGDMTSYRGHIIEKTQKHVRTITQHSHPLHCRYE